MAGPIRQIAFSKGLKALGGKLPGRNAPCPCGSGKKFKKCCLQDEHLMKRFSRR